MIDDERREFFGQDYCFNTDVIMTVTYRPDMLESQFARQAKRHNTASFQQEHLEYFRTILAQLEDTLQTVLSMERLGSYEQEDEHGQIVTYSALLSHLQYCLTGDPQPILAAAALGDLVEDQEQVLDGQAVLELRGQGRGEGPGERGTHPSFL